MNALTQAVIRVHASTVLLLADNPQLAVCSIGSGLGMAALDHLHDCYPELRMIWYDLPPALQSRAMVIDYVATQLPTVVLAWHSLTGAAALPQALAERDFRPKRLWCYIQSEDRSAVESCWAELFATIIKSFWDRNPLGDLNGL